MANVSFPSVQQIFMTNNSNTNNSVKTFEPKTSFVSVLKNSIDQLNNTQVEADQMTNKLINGGSNVDLSQVMIAQQKANITLQAAVEVRNKVIDVYQEMMRMQV